MSRSAGRQLLAFYLLALAIPAAVMAAVFVFRLPDAVGGLLAYLARESRTINLVSIARYAVGEPTAWLILLFAAAPSLAALVVSTASGGGRAARGLLGRLAPAGPGRSPRSVVRPYLLILGTSAVILAGYLWWGARVGSDESVAASRLALGGGPLAIAWSLAIGHLIDEGGTLEELGWRGFALPRLVALLGSPIGATIALGLGWWAWHLPRDLPALLSSGFTADFLTVQGLFLATCLALSVLATWGWMATGGSALPGVLIHGGSNVWSKALGSTVNSWAGTDVRAIIVVLLAVPAAWWLVRRGGQAAVPASAIREPSR